MEMNAHTFREVRVQFVLREQADGGFTYRRLWPNSPSSDGMLHMTEPPALGDRVMVEDSGTQGEVRGLVYGIVIEREWAWPQYGSLAWQPSGVKEGPILTCMIKHAGGLYEDEVATRIEDVTPEA